MIHSADTQEHLTNYMRSGQVIWQCVGAEDDLVVFR